MFCLFCSVCKSMTVYLCVFSISVSVAQNSFPDFLVSGVVPIIQEGIEGYNLVSFGGTISHVLCQLFFWA